MVTLDVGCGVHWQGEVNCDYTVNDDGARTGTAKVKHHLNPKAVPNFVLCSCEYLPFKTGAFTKAYSRHVIEHVENPYLMLSEMVRVSNGNVELFCPHKLGDRIYAHIYLHKGSVPFHKGFFNKRWFYTASEKLACHCLAEYSKFLGVPFEGFSIFSVPLELHVKLRRRNIIDAC